MLRWGAEPVMRDAAPGVLEVELALPRRAWKSTSVDLVEDGDGSVAAAGELVARDLFHVEAPRWC